MSNIKTTVQLMYQISVQVSIVMGVQNVVLFVGCGTVLSWR